MSVGGPQRLEVEEALDRPLQAGRERVVELALNGDRANLAEFLPELGTIDFVHYDSDKSVEGRQYVMDAIAGRLAPDAVVVMDDIDDNTFFRDWVARGGRPCRVFARGRKYVGLTGI